MTNTVVFKWKVGITSVLILAFCYGSIGYQLHFYAQRRNIHERILQKRNTIREEEYTVIVVPDKNASAIQWTEPGKEFYYRGEMYDVVKRKDFSQKQYYYCIRDTKEEQLIVHFTRINRNRKKAQKTIQRGAHIQLFYFYPQSVNVLSSSDYRYNQPSFRLQTTYLIIPSPPPKMG